MAHNTYRPVESAPRRTDYIMLSKRAIRAGALVSYYGKQCGAPRSLVDDEVSAAKNAVLRGDSVWRVYSAACSHISEAADATGWFTFGEMR